MPEKVGGGANRARNEPTGRYYIAIISVRFCRTTAHSSGPPRKLCCPVWPQIERPPSPSGFFFVESKQMPRNHGIRTGRKHHHRRPVNENTLIIVRQRPEFRTERWLNGGVVCTLGRLCTSVPPTITRRGTVQQFPWTAELWTGNSVEETISFPVLRFSPPIHTGQKVEIEVFGAFESSSSKSNSNYTFREYLAKVWKNSFPHKILLLAR